jgi:hypothetical protein
MNFSVIGVRLHVSYNPEKFIPGGDEDDPNMEADFASIEREEKRRYLGETFNFISIYISKTVFVSVA